MALENVFYRALTEMGATAETADKVVDLLQEEISMTAKNHVLEATAPILAQLARLESNVTAKIDTLDLKFNARVDTLEARMKGWFQVFSVFLVAASAAGAVVGILKALGKI
jgi:uncharacterized membrane protein